MCDGRAEGRVGDTMARKREMAGGVIGARGK